MSDSTQRPEDRRSSSPTCSAHVARRLIEEMSRHIEGCHSVVRDVAKAHIPDFHFLDYEVSLFWKCEQSPIGMCVFRLDDRGRQTSCRYCGGPVERK